MNICPAVAGDSLKYINKDKASEWLGIPQSNSGDDTQSAKGLSDSIKRQGKPQFNSEDVALPNDKSSTAKIIQDFENPSISD